MKKSIYFQIDATGQELEKLDPADLQWGIMLSKPVLDDEGNEKVTALVVSNHDRVQELLRERFASKVDDTYTEDDAYADAVAMDALYVFQEIEALSEKYREYLGLK